MLNAIRSRKMLAILAAVLALGSSIAAQDPNKPAPKPIVPLKVDVVISRYEGDKKVSSLPFTLWVNANENYTTNLRMGMDVAIPSTSDGKPTVSYRNVGTSIDCNRAESLDGGRFALLLAIQDSSIYSAEPGGRANPNFPVGGYPAFRSFTSNTHVVVREGQPVQYTMATDKISGEVLKVDVTVATVK